MPFLSNIWCVVKDIFLSIIFLKNISRMILQLSSIEKIGLTHWCFRVSPLEMVLVYYFVLKSNYKVELFLFYCDFSKIFQFVSARLSSLCLNSPFFSFFLLWLQLKQRWLNLGSCFGGGTKAAWGDTAAGSKDDDVPGKGWRRQGSWRIIFLGLVSTELGKLWLLILFFLIFFSFVNWNLFANQYWFKNIFLVTKNFWFNLNISFLVINIFDLLVNDLS